MLENHTAKIWGVGGGGAVLCLIQEIILIQLGINVTIYVQSGRDIISCSFSQKLGYENTAGPKFPQPRSVSQFSMFIKVHLYSTALTPEYEFRYLFK